MTVLNGFKAAVESTVTDPAARDLTMRQLAVLMHVGMTPGPHTVRGLAAYLKLQKPVITRAVDSLSEPGLVRRVSDPADRRSVLITITAAGRGHLARIEDALVDSAEERAA